MTDLIDCLMVQELKRKLQEEREKKKYPCRIKCNFDPLLECWTGPACPYEKKGDQ